MAAPINCRLLLIGILLSVNTCAATPPVSAVSVLTFHNDNFRTGQNTNEAILTPANVASANFAKLFSQTVDGYVFAQPLIVANVNLPGKGVKNVLIIATEHDSVYAFDADKTYSSPLWHASFLNPGAGVTSVPSTDMGSPGFPSEFGITSTPVIDPISGTIYVEAKTKEVSGATTNYVHRLHALDITTGAEKFGGPAVITATVSGNGDGNNGGSLQFNGLRQLNRCALLLHNGVVYVGFASLGDLPPYHGWLFGYDAKTLAQTSVFNSNPNGADSGFWESGCGPATDTNGNIYISTGNGTFDGPANDDYGDSLLKLSTTNGLELADYFTPHDQNTLKNKDLDFGSGGMTILPDEVGSAAHPHLLVCSDKRGTIYLVDRENLSHFNTPTDLVVQEMPSNIFKSWGSPAYYDHRVYFIGSSNALKAFSISNATISSTIVSNAVAYGATAGTPSVSANGAGNAMVWAIDAVNNKMHTYSATNVAVEIGSGKSVPSAVKFSTVTIANGKAYVGTTSTVQVFGLTTPTITAQPQGLHAIAGANATFTVAATTTAAPLRYQWFRNNIALLNQTNASLTITNIQITDGGAYTVVVSDNVGSALSVIALLNLTGITRNNDGTTTVAFLGTPGQSYHLEATTNIDSPTSWQMLPGSATNAPPGGLWQFTDTAAANYPLRFYRSVSP